MFEQRKKDASAARVKQIIKFAFRAAFACFLVFLLGKYYNSLHQQEGETENARLPSVEYLIDAEEDFPLQSRPDNIIDKCLDSRSNTDFLYEDEISEQNEKIAEPEIVNEEYKNSSAAALFYEKLAEFESADKKPIDKNTEEDDFIEKLPEESLAKIYEEDLPNDIIVEDSEDKPIPPELLADGYHIFTDHKDVKSLNIIPAYKPVYFGKEPVIAVVIDDMGISQKRTADIISLRAPLTASFLTYGRALDQQVENAKTAGLEIMVHTPMEPHSKADLAPDTLTTQMSIDEVKSGLISMLDKFHDIKGINNHMGSKLTEDFERMNAVMGVLKERDLFFLDSKTTAFSVAKKAARQHSVSYATRHVFLDNENKVDYVLKQLSVAERIARRNGYAVAIGHPKTATYQALKEWLPALQKKGIKLVPMSEIVKVLRQSHV